MLEILINNNSNCYNNNNSHNNNNYNNNNNNYNNNNNNSNYDNYKLEKNSNCWTCSPSPTALDLILSIIEFWLQRKWFATGFPFSRPCKCLLFQIVVWQSTGYEMHKVWKRTWWAIVPLSGSLIWLLILPSSHKFPCKLVMRIWR